MTTGTAQKISHKSGGYLNIANIQMIETMYEAYREDPSSVADSWKHFFEGYEFAVGGKSFNTKTKIKDNDEANVEALVHAFRRLGHLSADLNPLKPREVIAPHLSPEKHGLSSVDPKRIFHTSNLNFHDGADTFENIYQFLVETYCGSIGADYREVNNIDAVTWLQEKMEATKNKPTFGAEAQMELMSHLARVEAFEKFLQDRFLGQKRFSIEGLDSLIPLLHQVAETSSTKGAEEICIGMAHRGRLNVLANFMQKNYEAILAEFEGAGEEAPLSIEGDVKYHKGYVSEVMTKANKALRLYLAPNPSHLEAVNPVLEGFVKCRQRHLGDEVGTKVVPVLIHGDAAIVGQGIVAETFNLAYLESYTTGGTIHIIANNQLGFTATPEESRSCDYASDIAKFIRAPVFHVNADDPEAVVWVSQLATEFRQKFQSDVVIDLVGYRRHGHNETDEPAFTQPEMYSVIRKHPSVLNLYDQKVPNAQAKELVKKFRSNLQESLDAVRNNPEILAKTGMEVPEEMQTSIRFQQVSTEDLFKPVQSGVAKKKAKDIAAQFLTIPGDFEPHPKIKKLFETRATMLEGSGALDWGMGELLALATTKAEGHFVRLTGQDSARGTFSHRHAVIHDKTSGQKLNILNQVEGGPPCEVVNSPLSEQACMGFEQGYSVADHDALVMWEAQFGDFVNGAQIIIDQFLVASEAKWKQASNLVLLLPHGYEGQGPEHSSARPERFLQSCGNDNIQVVNPTTPAQYFHVLRRQIKRDFVKPLVVLTPKSLLRHPEVISTYEDFKGQFEEIITLQKSWTKIERIIFCSGKIYYGLKEKLTENKTAEKIAIVRIEQLYPFPEKKVTSILNKLKTKKDICWVQEEPVNMGFWNYVRPRFEKILKKSTIHYIGRRSSGSTAEGTFKSHLKEQDRILNEATKLK